jgi:hypothetical protein
MVPDHPTEIEAQNCRLFIELLVKNGGDPSTNLGAGARRPPATTPS